MKRLIILLTLFYSIALKAQLYIDFSAGYGIPFLKPTTSLPYQNSTIIDYYKQVYDTSTTSGSSLQYLKSYNSNKNLKIKLGTGLTVAGGLSYFINKYFGISTGYSYNIDSISFTKNVASKYIVSTNEYFNNKIDTSGERIEQILNSKANKFSLGLIFQLPLNKFTPFIKGSFSLNNKTILVTSKFGNVYNANYTQYYDYNNEYPIKYTFFYDEYVIEKYTSSLSCSYSASLGIKRTYTNFDVFFETSFNFDKFIPTKGKIIDSYGDFQYLPKKGDNITFVDMNSLPSDYITDPKYSSYYNGVRRIKSNYNFSTINFSIGFQYKIPTNKNDLVFFNQHFLSHLFIELSNGYSFALNNKELAYPYCNNIYETYLSKDSIYDPTWGTNHYRYYIEKTIFKIKPVKMNFASGYHIIGTLGYYFSDYFGLSFSYNSNNTNNDFNVKKTYSYSVANDYYGNKQLFDELSFNFNSINKSYVTCGIVQYPLNKKFLPFIKFGIALSKHEIFVSRQYNSYNYLINPPELSISQSSKEKYYGNFSFGKIMSVGLKYNLVNNLWVTFESSFTLENYVPYKVFISNISNSGFPSSSDGYDVYLMNYEDGGNVNNNQMPNPVDVGGRYKNTFAYSTININIGIQYILNFKKIDCTTPQN